MLFEQKQTIDRTKTTYSRLQRVRGNTPIHMGRATQQGNNVMDIITHYCNFLWISHRSCSSNAIAMNVLIKEVKLNTNTTHSGDILSTFFCSLSHAILAYSFFLCNFRWFGYRNSRLNEPE